ncbi:hypothetical protein L6164_021427 [Bauhinia variegata]|uniref:Uncharacterized protein n=1 Tax=Bauhinia variegata TaxID=167791 RepID=A0ACB9N256_BAUVA|nr:hypothetical protein L6164_021427 [Bauhinia variegata]
MALLRTASILEDGSAGATVIAVDKDRNSPFAVKWAVENLLKKNFTCTLLHVRTKNLHPNEADAVLKEGRPPTEEELHQLFLPFRGFCARKGIESKELVLHNTEVSSALTDYVINNSVRNIVVGSPQRNIITRQFKDADVPTNLIRSLPQSCTIHIISKGKVQSIRPTGHTHKGSISATGSIKVLATTMENSPLDHSPKPPPDTPDSEDKNRNLRTDGNWSGSGSHEVSSGQKIHSHESKGEVNSPRLSAQIFSPQKSSSQHSLSPCGDHSGQSSCISFDVLHENLEVPMNSDSPKSSSSPKTPKALEVEIMRLKQELLKTMDKYSTACREAVAAKQKAVELEQNKEEEKRNLEEARQAEEAALTLAELERQKRSAAVESALMAERLAKMEIQKRREVEMRARHEEEEGRKAINIALARNHIPRRKYNIEEIEVATCYFDNARKIGEGGYGPVFYGVLDHTAVAIKVLRPDLAHGERQFQKEVEVLSTIRHPNMVLLLGACPEYGCLVYEYLENGSLEDRLFQKDNTPPLSWQTRFRIAAEIATGLLFLHQTKPEPLVHRDLKPANILLDRNYVSKISDVGLARLVPPAVANATTQYHMTAAAGTFCYIDPEYQQTGMLGVKSDIYSLGVMLLQIITGKPPMGLSHQVEKAIENGRFPPMLDPSVTDWPVEETLSCAKLALQCCEMRKRDRPDLGNVILPELNRLRELGEISDSDNLTATQEGMSKNPNVDMENST